MQRFTAFSALYVGIGFYYLIETRFYGFEYVFYALLVIWTTTRVHILLAGKSGNGNYGQIFPRIKQ